MRPVTDRQWQEAVDAAHLLTMIEVGRLFGLATGESFVDLDACFAILAEARERGIVPAAQDSAVRRAALAVLDKCDTELRVLDCEQWLGPELLRLREALRLPGEEVLLADRKVS